MSAPNPPEPHDEAPRRKAPNILLVLVLAVALPVLGVFVMQTVRRIVPIIKETSGQTSPTPESTPRPSPTPPPTPVLSPLAPTPGQAGAPIAQAPLVSGAIPPGETSGAPAAESEVRLVQQEVLKRIDLMPTLTPTEQDKLYVQVERARRMTCVARLAFAPGGASPTSTQLQKLSALLSSPDNKALLSDPTTVLVVLGFADKKGDDAANLRVSLARADNVRTALRDQCGVQNVMHSVGMGSSDMFDANNLDKNRLVEVWIVLP